MPAWPTSQRMVYDRAYGMAVAGGTLYYATSTDGRVVALDAATGSQRWCYVTDAPVRFPPALWRDRVFAAGDDGFLYCLAAADGHGFWKLRGGPRTDMLLGNDRMISRWPARGGPVVVDGIVYFRAGIWPSEGVFLYAVDAATGKPLWCNDSSGTIEMAQPHPGAKAKSGVAAQGNLVVAGDALLVPTGRAVPAVFDRADGKFRYFHLQANRSAGGSAVVAIDRHFFNGGTMFDTADGALSQVLASKGLDKPEGVGHSYVADIQIAAHPRWVVYSAENRLSAIDRQKLVVEKQSTDAKDKKTKAKALATPAWSVQLLVPEVASLIVAGDSVVVGAKNLVMLCDAASGQTEWQAQVQGTAYDLAVADGRLYVSTDCGVIYCFGKGDRTPIEIRLPQAQPDTHENTAYALAAEEILRRSEVRDGYYVDLACGEGRLALELARRTKLQIYAVEADPGKVRTARRLLEDAGLYGVRVTVHQADPGKVPYPDYFADLVVSGRSVTEGAETVPRESLTRMQRPYGGVACIGRPGALQFSNRGPLAGAADWTHQYADAANTLCSGDGRLKGPLHMLWFRDTDLTMPSRHGRGPAPLVSQGRMFVEGLHALRTVNIYNGSTLWEVSLPRILAAYHQDHLGGAATTSSNFCLGEDRVFIHNGQTCLVLDGKTGRQVAEWKPPTRPDGKPGTWGYLAHCQAAVFGSVANEEHVIKESWRSYLGKLDMSHLFSESISLFALDAQTGRLKWQFTPQHSIRHNAIAVGRDRIYLIDRPPALVDRPLATKSKVKPAQPGGRLLCLNAESGKILWQSDDAIFGTLLALSEPYDVLLMTYQPTRFKLDSELGNRMAAFRASDGTRLWDCEAKYQSRPILNDTAIYAEPGKWNLLSGQAEPFEFSRSYGCGILAASKRLLVFRSATLGYFDLGGNQQTENYGGIRPGCWINAIPAGGLVLLAEAASWCTCSYLNQATIALQPMR